MRFRSRVLKRQPLTLNSKPSILKILLASPDMLPGMLTAGAPTARFHVLPGTGSWQKQFWDLGVSTLIQYPK